MARRAACRPLAMPSRACTSLFSCALARLSASGLTALGGSFVERVEQRRRFPRPAACCRQPARRAPADSRHPGKVRNVVVSTNSAIGQCCVTSRGVPCAVVAAHSHERETIGGRGMDTLATVGYVQDAGKAFASNSAGKSLRICVNSAGAHRFATARLPPIWANAAVASVRTLA